MISSGPPSDAYERALRRLTGLGRLSLRAGLERVAGALERLGAPQQRFAAVHVAGTNGKGSTAAFLTAALRAAGHRTGLYTSPHLCRFSERIQVDGVEIPEPAVVEGLERVLQAEPSLTFFEAATVIAFQHFAAEGVEVAVVETGMGGALDATNVISPRVSVLTRIDLDHLEIIGPDQRAVAREKAGIIKAGAASVSAPAHPVVLEELARRSAEVGVPLLVGGRDFHWRHQADGLLVDGPAGVRRGLRLSLAGDHQWENAALAVTALDLLARSGRPVPEAAIRRGLAEARWPGRLERVGEVLLDGAHNGNGARALAAFLDGDSRRWTVVLGLLGPRQPEEVMEPLRRHARRFLLTRPDNARALDPALLLAHAARISASSSA